MLLAPLSCDEIAEPTAAIYPGVNMSCLVLVGCIASAGRPEKNPPAPDRTNLSPPRRPRSSPATMSPSAIFVFLLVSAVHMLECILDLKRRVGANCQENPALSFLSLLFQIIHLGRNVLILDGLMWLRMNLHGKKKPWLLDLPPSAIPTIFQPPLLH